MHDQLAGGVRRRRRAQTTDMNSGLQQRLQVRGGEGVKTVSMGFGGAVAAIQTVIKE